MGLLIKNYETIALLEAHWLAAFERLLVGETLTFLSQAARAEGKAPKMAACFCCCSGRA